MPEVEGVASAVPATGAASAQRESDNGRSFDSLSSGSVWDRVRPWCRRLDELDGGRFL